jgi:hypothetical protein
MPSEAEVGGRHVPTHHLNSLCSVYGDRYVILALRGACRASLGKCLSVKSVEYAVNVTKTAMETYAVHPSTEYILIANNRKQKGKPLTFWRSAGTLLVPPASVPMNALDNSRDRITLTLGSLVNGQASTTARKNQRPTSREVVPMLEYRLHQRPLDWLLGINGH